MHGRRKVMKESTQRHTHGDGRDRAIGLRGQVAVSSRQVYKRLMNRPVLHPAVPPDTDGRVLTAAVKTVVELRK